MKALTEPTSAYFPPDCFEPFRRQVVDGPFEAYLAHRRAGNRAGYGGSDGVEAERRSKVADEYAGEGSSAVQEDILHFDVCNSALTSSISPEYAADLDERPSLSGCVEFPGRAAKR